MPMSADPEYVIVGKLGAAYGVKGWIKVISFTEPLTNIFEYLPWQLGEKDHWKPIKVEDGREHGKGLVVKLAGTNTPEAAKLLTGKSIAVTRSQLPVLKKGEYLWSDLEGLTVINDDGTELGKVIYLIETGSNDVLVVKGEREHAIPYLPDNVITSIDLEKRVMHVKWEVI